MHSLNVLVCPIVVALSMPAFSATAAPGQISSTSCPDPVSPLSQVHTQVDRESPKPMTEDTSVARLDVASAYAAQQGGENGANWCVRYEVINNGPDAVPLFYWDLPGMKINEYKPSDGPQSVILTLSPGPDPVKKDTVLNGFKAQSIDTKAYQSAEGTVKKSMITFVASTNNAGRPSNEPLVLENGGRLPEVGSEFTGAGAQIGAASVVTRENDVYHFTVQIGIHDGKSVQSVVAPLTLTLAKLGSDFLSPTIVNSVLQDVKTYELRLDNNEFSVKTDFPASKVSKIYVVRQPIAFKRADKSDVCFLAPIYLPIPIADNWTSCK